MTERELVNPDQETVYVSAHGGTARKYHVDEDCERFDNEPEPRPREVAEQWHDPCQYCAVANADPSAKYGPKTSGVGGKSKLERAIDNGEIDPEAFP